ncbi:MAG: CaiB/BaiF CoA transferase family protein [Thalassobaculaceae bacterium]
MFQPLSNIRVVDLTQVLAGPYATYQLALMGAEVLKIEQPNLGDWTRDGAAPEGLQEQKMATSFLTQNAGKKSITLDLKKPGDLKNLKKLIKTADVFVENFRPGTAERLGLSSEEVFKIKPNLIYCSISAYGHDGPKSQRPAYDHIVQGMSGIMKLTGTPDTEPNKVGAPYIDYATGMNAALAIVSALHELKRTQKGIVLDVAMLDTSLLLMASLMTNHLNTGWQPEASGNEAWSQSPSSGAFETKEGLLMIAANNERQYESLCEALELEYLLEDTQFCVFENRKRNSTKLRKIFADKIHSETADFWESRLEAFAVPAAKVRRLDEILYDPQVLEREVTKPIRVDGSATPLHMPTLGFKINGETVSPNAQPPRLGEHNSILMTDPD